MIATWAVAGHAMWLGFRKNKLVCVCSLVLVGKFNVIWYMRSKRGNFHDSSSSGSQDNVVPRGGRGVIQNSRVP